MDIRERLCTIPELNISKLLQLITGTPLDNYVASLHSFVEDFPVLEAEVKNSMEAKDFKSVIKNLKNIHEILVSISADELANECKRRLDNFDINRPDRIETYVSFLLSTLTSLSIDIQMAFFKEEDKESQSATSDGQVKEGSAVKTILAVDDDAYSLDIFKAALKDLTCKIIPVTSGLAALGVLDNLKPDLFVLDIDMPEMDGIELARNLRALGQNAPIVFITGNATKIYVRRCMQAGAQEFIVKPINPQDAVNRIQKFL